MTRRPRRTILPTTLLALLAVALMPAPAAHAQRPDAAGATATLAPPSGPKLVVLPFDFAAPTPPVPPMRRGRYAAPPPIFGPGLGRGGGGGGVLPVPVDGGTSAGAAASQMRAPVPRRDDPYFRDDLTNGIGAGVADLLVERLVEAGGFRVLERKHLDAVLAERAMDSTARAAGGGASTTTRRPPAGGADYVVTGSVVRFGVEEKHALGGLGRITGLGVLGLKRPKTKVTLVARVVDAASGEVVLAFRGEGVSRKGTGLTLGGIARGAGGVVSVGSSSFRESALGEATLRAVDSLATRLSEKRGTLTRQ